MKKKKVEPRKKKKTIKSKGKTKKRLRASVHKKGRKGIVKLEDRLLDELLPDEEIEEVEEETPEEEEEEEKGLDEVLGKEKEDYIYREEEEEIL